MACHADKVVLNHVVSFGASGGCESSFAMLNQWLRIVVCYAVTVVVNNVVL
jgi:hypothetical protein